LAAKEKARDWPQVSDGIGFGSFGEPAGERSQKARISALISRGAVTCPSDWGDEIHCADERLGLIEKAV